MDLRDLAYFERIVEAGSLARAADRVGRTRPALTKCVRRLEDSIGSPLFERKGRRLALTSVGALLFQKARYMRVAMEELNAELAGHAQGDSGHVRIGAGPTVAEEWLPDILRQLLAAWPQVTAELVVGMSRNHREQLKENRLDIIISAALPEDYDSFRVYPIARDDVVVVCARGHALAGQPMRLENMLDYRWVLPDETAGSRQWLDAAFRAHGLMAPRIQIVANSIQLVPKLLEQAEFLSFMPRSNLAPGRVGEALVELVHEATTMPRLLAVLCRASMTGSPIVPRLLRLLKEKVVAREMLDSPHWAGGSTVKGAMF